MHRAWEHLKLLFANKWPLGNRSLLHQYGGTDSKVWIVIRIGIRGCSGSTWVGPRAADRLRGFCPTSCGQRSW